MEEEGYTLREIASELGVSAASVCHILKGRRRMVLPKVV
jgi:predicted transcriptional regulator